MITLIPGSSTLSSPMQFRANQDFYISSYTQLNCTQSLMTAMKWTVKNCTETDCSFQIQFDSSIATSFSELYVPARTFPYGTYEFVLSVTMSVSPLLTSSKSTFVRISPSGITANLVQFGTSLITSGRQQHLVLDPGSYSIDPDGYVFNSSVSNE